MHACPKPIDVDEAKAAVLSPCYLLMEVRWDDGARLII